MEEKNNSPTLSSDKEKVDSFLDGKTKKFDFAAFKRLVLTQLTKDDLFVDNKICGYTKEQISNMAQNPEKHGKQILKLSNFMYLKSGYYKRLVNYFTNIPKGECWTIDTEIKTTDFESVDKVAFKRNFIRYANLCNSFKLEYEISKIMLNIYLYDACFGYIVESDTDNFIYYFKPEYCEIIGSVNGMPMFGIKPNLMKRYGNNLSTYPPEIQMLIESGTADKYGRITIPYEKSFCIKYHELFSYLYPPLFPLIKEILNIEDYKSLEKTKVENEIYKLLALEIPINDDGQITLGDDIVTDFTTLANDIVSKSIGVLPSPFKVTPVEFSNSNTNDINNVQNAIDEAYSEVGVSQALMAGSTSGSELKISIEIDAGDIYRILKTLSKLVNFHCKVRGGVYGSYGFSFRLLEVTNINQADKVDSEFKLAQASFPNKFEVMATKGVNPARVIGNDFVENEIFKLGESWTVLKTAYTGANDEKSSDGGRPESKDTEITKGTETQRGNDSNKKENRI